MINRSTGGALNVPLTGTGLGPTATLSKTSVAFGGVFVGSTSAATAVTVTNNGNQALNFTTIAASGDFSVATGTTCAVGSAVVAGGNCAISLAFTPTAEGSRTGTLTITNNATGSPQSVPLSGTGKDFTAGAASGSSTSQAVTAGQTAIYNLAFTPQGISGTLALSCAGAPAGASCQIKVTFKPSATGTRTGSVTITDNAAGSPHSIGLSGTGVPPATPPNGYTLTITAKLTSSAGTLTHTLPLTLTVN